MNKLKFYQLATIVLLILNIGFVVFGFLVPPKGHHDPLKKISTELKLSEDQSRSFKALLETHHESIVSLNEKQKSSLSAYFQTLPSAKKTNEKNEIRSLMNKLESQKIGLTYKHFQEIYSLLNKDQQGLYAPFISQAVNQALGIQPNKRGPKKN